MDRDNVDALWATNMCQLRGIKVEKKAVRNFTAPAALLQNLQNYHFFLIDIA